MLPRFVRGLLILSLLVILTGLQVTAQDAPPEEVKPTDAPPVELPAETPPPTPTDMPTEIPTDPPTGIPTETPTEVPTDAPTDIPTEPVSPTPVVLSAPPAFVLAAGPAFEAPAGTPLAFQFAVTDDQGIVRVVEDMTGAQGALLLTVTAPAEAAPPFITTVEAIYTPAEGFTGVDSFVLNALDADGQTASLTVTITVIAPEATLEPTPEPTSIPDEERLITYNPSASEEAISAMLAALGAVEVDRLPQIGAMKVRIPLASSTTAGALSTLSALGGLSAQMAGLSSVEPNYIYSGAGFTPNDPFFVTGDQESLTGTFFANVSNPAAWDLAPTRGAGIRIAIVDSGVELAHPEFAGRILSGYDFINDDAFAQDDSFNSHGTHVAGIAAARANNGIGIAGAAFNALIIPVKSCNASVQCPVYEVAAGIIFATDSGARVINLSLGGPQISSTVQGAVNYALSRGVTVVAASGNVGVVPQGTYMYPASFPGVISVANFDTTTGAIAPDSMNNNRVTLAAPGDTSGSGGIVSTVRIGTGLLGGGNYGRLRGTSMAAPLVTGAVALILGANVATTPPAVREALICGAVDTGPLVGYDNASGFGLLQADWSLNWRFNSANCKITQPNDDYRTPTVITAPFNRIQPIHSRSVTAQPGDPGVCFNASQTLWYRFRPAVSGIYSFSTFGSTYDTQLGIFQGSPGAWTTVACNDDFSFPNFNSASFAAAGLQAGQDYYIVADPFGSSGQDDQLFQLDVRAGIPAANVFIQENAPSIGYSGTWSFSGGLARTTDNLATLAFSFRGNRLEYYRMVGPDQGSTEVWINGAMSVINNRAALNLIQSTSIPVPGLVQPGQINRVVLRRSSAGPAGAITLDRVRVFDDSVALPAPPITAITDDRAVTRFRYTGTLPTSWTQVGVAGSHLNTVTQTTEIGANVVFQATGNTITIFRNTDPTFGAASVYVDGQLVEVMSNSSGTGQKVPFVIQSVAGSPLASMTHVVKVENIAAGALQFDAAQATSPLPLAASPVIINENHPSLSYSGLWTSLASPLAGGGTSRQSTDLSGFLAFRFTGNQVCIQYTTRPDGGDFLLKVDNVTYGPVSTFSAGITYNNLYCSPVLADITHNVRLSVNAAVVEIDGVRASRMPVLTPALGLVQENNPAFSYNPFLGPWSVVTNATTGFRFQGGVARRSSTTGSIQFYMQGTGFVLYTTVGSQMGDWQVFMDGSLTPLNVTFADTIYDYIDLSNPRNRAIGYAVTNLPPGIHLIRLEKVVGGSDYAGTVSTNTFVDFDAVRILP